MKDPARRVTGDWATPEAISEGAISDGANEGAISDGAITEGTTAIPIHIGDGAGYDLVVGSAEAGPASPLTVGSRVTMVSLFEFACASCGRRVSLTQMLPSAGQSGQSGSISSPPPPMHAGPETPWTPGDGNMAGLALLHDTPACARYLENDFVEFLRLNRQDMGISDEMVDEMTNGDRN
jgi:hypothetical protein